MQALPPPLHGSNNGIAGNDGVERRLDEMLVLDGPFDIARATYVGARIASSLESAHQLGLVHGELAPSHVLIGDSDVITLADFGTEEAAPETIEADVRALGALLYEIASGYSPEKHENQRRPTRLSDINWSIPSEYESVVERALDGSRKDRFVRASQVCDALNQLGRLEPARSREPFEPNHMATVAVCAVVGVVALGVLLLTNGNASQRNVATASNLGGVSQSFGPSGFVNSPRFGEPIETPNAIVAPAPDVVAASPVIQTPSVAVVPAVNTITPTPVKSLALPRTPTTTTPPPLPPPTTTTMAPTPPTTAPGRLTAPENVHLTELSTTSAQLAWDSVQNSSGYVVQLKLGGNNGTVVKAPFTVTNTYVSFSGLKSGAKYTALIWPSDASIPGGPGSNQPHDEFSFTTR